jgi:hypothetical protein
VEPKPVTPTKKEPHKSRGSFDIELTVVLEAFLETLTRTEADGLGSLDLNRCPRFRVATQASAKLARAERTEADQLQPPIPPCTPLRIERNTASKACLAVALLISFPMSF